MKKILLSASVIIFSAIPLLAQKVIKGVVKDEAGETLPGSTIFVKGSGSSALADANGEFSVQAAKELPFTVTVNLVGYKTQDVEVYEITDETLEVTLQLDNVLNEVVVVGYGEQKRKDITGSVASVPTELKSQPVASVERLLQGSIPGAIVTQTSGQPGGGVSVQIRGSNSISASSDPLYVIDGFPINNDYSIADAGITNGPKINPLSTINSADIESIDVLKDASATAIYGSRGANGVIIVTTKKGKSNESSIHYDAYYGVQQVIRTLPLLTAGEWWQLRKDAAANTDAFNGVITNTNKLKTDNKGYLAAAEAGGYTLDTAGVGTDWQKAAFTQAAIQSHTLSILSGTDKTRLAISGNYFNQDGVIRNTGFTRYSLRFNIDHSFNDKFRIFSYVNASSISAKVAPDAIVSNLLSSPAALPIYKNDGTFLIQSGLDQALANPINSLYNQKNNTNTSRLLANVSGEYKILEGLTAKVLFGADVLVNKQNRYLPSSTLEGLTLKGFASVGESNTVNWLNENTLSYLKNINGIHSVNALAGFSVQRSTTESFLTNTSNYVTDFFGYNNLGNALTAGGGGATPASSNYNQWSLASWFGRVTYGLKEKYIATFTLRSDGSSRFGPENKWGYFPSAALAWNVHEEDFLKSIRQITFLKIRGSVGVTGNQSIPTYKSQAQLSYFRYNFNNQTVSGFAPTVAPNPNLGWEKTFQTDIGADIGLLNNRVNVVLDYYYKRTSDLLLDAIVSGTSGLALGGTINAGQQSFVSQNLGVVGNRGFEVGVNTQNIVGNFRWNTIAVFSVNRNKVLDLGNGVTRIVPNTNAPSVIEVGKPLGSFIVYKTDGLIQPGQEGPSALTPQAFKGVGAQKYVDVDDSGSITQAGDRVVIANQPGINAGLTNTFGYKGFDLSIFFQTSIGARLYNQNRAQLELNNGAGNGDAAAANAYRAPGTRGVDDPGNTNTDVKAAYQDPAITVSDRFIENASYLRLKNISFGYNIPVSLLSKIRVKSLRVYVSAQNIWTKTKYTGYDPETSQAGQSLINRGVDSGVYPNNKLVQGGIQLSF